MDQHKKTIRFRRLGRSASLAVFLALALSVAGMLSANVPAAAAAPVDDEPVAVDLAGVVVLRLRIPVNGQPPLERANVLYRQWADALAAAGDSLSPDLVRIEDANGVPVIYLGSVPFTAVDEGHARLNGTTPRLLAEVWARNLRRAVARHLEIHAP